MPILVIGTPLDPRDKRYAHLDEAGVYILDDCPASPSGFVVRLSDGQLFEIDLSQAALLCQNPSSTIPLSSGGFLTVRDSVLSFPGRRGDFVSPDQLHIVSALT